MRSASVLLMGLAPAAVLSAPTTAPANSSVEGFNLTLPLNATAVAPIKKRPTKWTLRSLHRDCTDNFPGSCVYSFIIDTHDGKTQACSFETQRKDAPFSVKGCSDGKTSALVTTRWVEPGVTEIIVAKDGFVISDLFRERELSNKRRIKHRRSYAPTPFEAFRLEEEGKTVIATRDVTASGKTTCMDVHGLPQFEGYRVCVTPPK